jgi:uncharacterized RDD family membrane protein YckC
MSDKLQISNHDSPITNRLFLTTPEGISLALTLAGPGSRFIALLIDSLFISVLVTAIFKAAGIFFLINPELRTAFLFIAQLVTGWAYYIVFEWKFRGQSPGKKLFNLRVMNKDGFHLRLGQIVLRNLFRGIDSIPLFYLLGGFVCMFSSRNQRIGDMVAATVVIYDRHFSPPHIEHISPDKFNSFFSYPHLISRARQQITPRESSMLLKALLRRERLLPESRIKLYEELSDYFKSIVDFPAENISDEQYLRNLFGILYHRKEL